MKTVNSIANSFGAASLTYADHCDAQRKAAEHLAALLQEIKTTIPEGIVLEIGCGTGVFTELLTKILSERELVITDVSAAMVKRCKQNVGASIHFAVQDAEQITEENKYALIVCAFAAQWFKNIEVTFDRLLKALIPGGYLLVSVPTDGSFPEWKIVCLQTNVEYSGNALPLKIALESYFDSRGKLQKFETQSFRTYYSSSLRFFKTLKNLGAALRLAETTDGHTSLRSIIRHWDKGSGDQVCATYEVFFGAIQK